MAKDCLYEMVLAVDCLPTYSILTGISFCSSVVCGMHTTELHGQVGTDKRISAQMPISRRGLTTLKKEERVLMANKDKDAWSEEWIAGVPIATAQSGGKEDILYKENAELASEEKGKRPALADTPLLNLGVVQPKDAPVEYGRTKVNHLAAYD